MSLILEERVDRGARFLDEKEPGWWDKIDLETLNMKNCYLCILGQLTGDYFINKYFRIDKADLGFTQPEKEQWLELGRLWKAEILKRRANPPC